MAEGGRTSLRVQEPVADDLGGVRTGESLPARRDVDLRAYLPGVEPERQLDDWGRSERVEGLIERLYYFYYHCYFRAEGQGNENRPATEGALLVLCHAPAVAPDAP